MRRMFFILAFALIAAACAGPSSPNPDQISQKVQKAVDATLAVRATQVAASTATILPPTVALTATREQLATATTVSTAIRTDTPTAASTATPTPTETPTEVPSATPTMVPSVIADRVVNLRAGPGINYPIVGTTAQGGTYAIQSRNNDGTWLEICCVDKLERTAWVGASVVKTTGDINRVLVAKNIPTPPPSPTPVPAASGVSPQGWRTYKSATAAISLNYPPHWKIKQERPDGEGVVFAPDDTGFFNIWLLPGVAGVPGDKSRVDFFTEMVLGAASEDRQIEILQTTVLWDKADGIFVTQYKPSSDSGVGLGYVFWPLDATHTIAVEFMTVRTDGYKLSTNELPILEKVLDSVKVSQGP